MQYLILLLQIKSNLFFVKSENYFQKKSDYMENTKKMTDRDKTKILTLRVENLSLSEITARAGFCKSAALLMTDC